MIKICDESLLKPLLILFKNSLKLSYYPDIWKKSNIIPAHKKNDKQLLNPIQDGLFRGRSRLRGGGIKRPPSLKSVAHIQQ